MKSIINITIFILFTINILNAQPKIKYENKSHDFGDIMYGTLPTHFFKFTNTGDKPLILTTVKASCGCTSPFWTRDSIMPGDSGFIKVVFNTSSYKNKTFAKSVLVTTNAPKGKNQQMDVLYIKGKVLPKGAFIPQYPITLSKELIRLGDVIHGKKIKFRIALFNEGDSVVTLKEIKQGSAKYIIEIKKKTDIIQPKDSLELTFTVVTKRLEAGHFYETFKFITNLPTKNTKIISEKGIAVTAKLITKEEAEEERKKANR